MCPLNSVAMGPSQPVPFMSCFQLEWEVGGTLALSPWWAMPPCPWRGDAAGSCREATNACREGRAAWGITWCGQGISEKWQGEIPAASGHGTGEEQDVSGAGFSNFLPWLKPRFSTEGMWLMAEIFPLALDDIYVDYLWVTFLGGFFFFFFFHQIQTEGKMAWWLVVWKHQRKQDHLSYW